MVPCSDVGGEVVAVGKSVTKWKIGDRVTSAFSLTHLHGVATLQDFNMTLGGQIDGVLTEYRPFPEQVSVRCVPSTPCSR